MRTTLAVVIGLLGGFVAGIFLTEVAYRLFGVAGAAAANPLVFALIGAVAGIVVDRVARRESS